MPKLQHFEVYPGLSSFDLCDVVFCLRKMAENNRQTAAGHRATSKPDYLGRAVALMFEQQAERFTKLADRLDS